MRSFAGCSSDLDFGISLNQGPPNWDCLRGVQNWFLVGNVFSQIRGVQTSTQDFTQPGLSCCPIKLVLALNFTVLKNRVPQILAPRARKQD